MICMKVGQADDGRGWIEEVTATLDAGEIDGGAEGDLLALQNATATYTALFGEEEIPEEIAALQSRFASLRAADGGHPVVPTTDIPPA